MNAYYHLVNNFDIPTGIAWTNNPLLTEFGMLQEVIEVIKLKSL